MFLGINGRGVEGCVGQKRPLNNFSFDHLAQYNLSLTQTGYDSLRVLVHCRVGSRGSCCAGDDYFLRVAIQNSSLAGIIAIAAARRSKASLQ